MQVHVPKQLLNWATGQGGIDRPVPSTTEACLGYFLGER